MSQFGQRGRGGNQSFGKGGGGNQNFGRGGGKGKGGYSNNYGGGGSNNYQSGGRGGGRGGKGKGGYSSWGGGGKGKGGNNDTLPKQQAVLEGHTDTVNCLTVSEAKSQCFSGSKDGTIRIWSWDGGQGFRCVHTLPVGAPVEALHVLDSWLIAGTAHKGGVNGVVKVWNMESQFEQTMEGHQGSVYCLAQGGAYLFSAGDDMGIKTWQFGGEKFDPVIELKGHTAAIQTMKCSGNSLLSADRAGTVSMWDLTTGQSTGTIQTGHTDILMALWMEESYLFTASLDGRVKVWDATGGAIYEHGVTNLQHQPSGITALLLMNEASADPSTPGEPVLITACNDLALKLWKMPGFDRRGILAARVGHSDVVRCLAKGPGNSFFSGGIDKKIIVWEFQPPGGFR